MKLFIDQLKRTLFLYYLLLLGTVFFFCTGTLILIARALLDTAPSRLAWSLFGIIPVAVISLVLALRRMPGPAAIRAYIDKYNQSGGLFITSQTTDISGWESRLTNLKAPLVRVHCRQDVALVLIAAAFATGSLFMPCCLSDSRSRTPLSITNIITDLNNKISLLEEEECATEEETRAFKEEIETIAEQATADNPGRTWEALDNMEKVIRDKSRQAAGDMSEDMEKLTACRNLAQALPHTKELGTDVEKAGMEMLRDMVRDASAQKQLAEFPGKELNNALKQGNLSEEDLKKLCQMAQACGKKMLARMKKMCDAGLIDPKMLQACKACNGKGMDAKALQAFLKANGKDMDPMALLALCSEGKPGKGGINRGRGDAPLTWKDESSEQDTAFREESIPPAGIRSLKKSKLIGLSSGEHDINTAQLRQKNTSYSNTDPGGGTAHEHKILPRHKGTIQRYFKRKDE